MLGRFPVIWNWHERCYARADTRTLFLSFFLKNLFRRRKRSKYKRRFRRFRIFRGISRRYPLTFTVLAAALFFRTFRGIPWNSVEFHLFSCVLHRSINDGRNAFRGNSMEFRGMQNCHQISHRTHTFGPISSYNRLVFRSAMVSDWIKCLPPINRRAARTGISVRSDACLCAVARLVTMIRHSSGR